jgi:DNA-binding XRE family transcriptional regulator
LECTVEEESMKNRPRAFRAERNWSQQELADRLEVSRQSVSAIETGRFDLCLAKIGIRYRIRQIA